MAEAADNVITTGVHPVLLTFVDTGKVVRHL